MSIAGYIKGTVAPGVSTLGVWSAFTWDNQGATQHGLRLTPETAPWREVLAALDALPEVAAQPVSVREEAAAMVAACWRYGSYVLMLAEGQTYAPFKANPNLSRISDDEMRRIQLEFSSGLAEWLRVRASNPELHRHRVLAARHVLPGVPLANIGPYAVEDAAERWGRQLTTLADAYGAAGLLDAEFGSTESGARLEANFLVDRFYRNGRNVTAAGPDGMPLEELHAGPWSEGREVPGYKRLYAEEAAAIMRPILRGLTIHLAARAPFGLHELAPVFVRLGPTEWSLTDETSAVPFYGMPGAGSLQPRLAQLSQKNPVLYGRREGSA